MRLSFFIIIITILSSGCFNTNTIDNIEMTNDKMLSLALLQEPKADKKINNINHILESSLKIFSGKSALVEESPNFGKYKPIVPKNGLMKRFGFESSNFYTNISMNKNLDNISSISIVKSGMKSEIKKEELKLDSLNLTLLNTKKDKRLKIRSNDKYDYEIDYLFTSNNYPNVLISFLVSYSTEAEFNTLKDSDDLPKIIDLIRVSSKDESQLKPFQTIGSLK